MRIAFACAAFSNLWRVTEAIHAILSSWACHGVRPSSIYLPCDLEMPIAREPAPRTRYRYDDSQCVIPRLVHHLASKLSLTLFLLDLALEFQSRIVHRPDGRHRLLAFTDHKQSRLYAYSIWHCEALRRCSFFSLAILVGGLVLLSWEALITYDEEIRFIWWCVIRFFFWEMTSDPVVRS